MWRLVRKAIQNCAIPLDGIKSYILIEFGQSPLFFLLCVSFQNLKCNLHKYVEYVFMHYECIIIQSHESWSLFTHIFSLHFFTCTFINQHKQCCCALQKTKASQQVTGGSLLSRNCFRELFGFLRNNKVHRKE